MNIIKNIMVITTMVMMSTLVFTSTAMAEDLKPIGYWKTVPDDDGMPALVEVYERDGKIFGSIRQLFPQKPSDDPNSVCDKCKGKDKDKPIVGMEIIRGLKKDDDEYSGGKILDPKNGKLYKCYIQVIEGGKRLKVRGYVGFSLLGRSQYWVKAEAPKKEKTATEEKPAEQ